MVFLSFSPELLAGELNTENGEAICTQAGSQDKDSAENFSWFFGKTDGEPLYLSAYANFQARMVFLNEQGKQETKEVTARATHRFELSGLSDKPLKIRIQGGIAKLRESTKNFVLFLGYQDEGKAMLREMGYLEGNPAGYKRYETEFAPNALKPGPTQVWLEGHYEEFGQKKAVYENNGGINFSLSLAKTPHKFACFAEGWKQAFKGEPLTAGDSIGVIYQHDRIRRMLSGTTYNGYPAWNLEGHYLVRDSQNNIISQGKFPCVGEAFDPPSGHPALDRAGYIPAIHIPKSATGGKLELWFQGFARGAPAWDSDYGRNYIVPIR